MLRLFIIAVAIIFLCLPTRAQETIYMANGTKVPFRLSEANADVVKYSEPKGNSTIKRSFRRENILIAFNSKAKYLVISDISKNSDSSKVQIDEFYSTPGSDSDILIKAIPLKAINGTVKYVNDKIVNYATKEGASGSLSKNELVAILYKDGRHELVMPADEAAPLLASLSKTEKKRLTPPTTFTLPTEKEHPVTKQSSLQTNIPAKKTATKENLTRDDVQEYQKKSLRQVDEFVQYLDIIADKTIPSDEKDKAIEQALKLFLPDATIQVTSANRSGSRSFPVKDYLRRLKLLPYGSVRIEWNEVNYVSELTLAADGNYYGRISGTQTFKGYNASGKNIIYSDVTQKSVDVKLQSYSKSIEGNLKQNWEVLLGNIGVSTDK